MFYMGIWYNTFSKHALRSVKTMQFTSSFQKQTTYRLLTKEIAKYHKHEILERKKGNKALADTYALNKAELIKLVNQIR